MSCPRDCAQGLAYSQFDVSMSCSGCSSAIERVLEKAKKDGELDSLASIIAELIAFIGRVKCVDKQP